MDSPNPLQALISMVRARRLRAPQPSGTGTVDHGRLEPVLEELAEGGVGVLADHEAALAGYIRRLGSVDPDGLAPAEAKAFWLNLYNAGALDLARRTWESGAPTVLRLRGAFTDPYVTVSGEQLSLDGIEHGKVRRFGDPRIHAALVCGSASCPTLRFETYRGDRVEEQLDDQMQAFLAGGAAVPDHEGGVLALSRVFRWYGADFVRPHRMPTLLPATRRAVRDALVPWMEPGTRQWIADADPSVEFQTYDWALGCTVR